MRILSLKTVTSIGLVLGLLVMFGCGGSSSDPIVQSPINLSGGNAITGTGGSGGYFYVESFGALTLSTSSIISTPVPPEPVTTFLYTVNADEEVQLDPGADAVGLYVITDDATNSIYLGLGDSVLPDPRITGLFVPQGVTLTLPKNDTTGFLALLDNDIVINGTVITYPESLDIYFDILGNLIVGNTGLITTKPVSTDTDGGNITFVTGIDIFNQGIIDASGGGSGFAASIVLEANGALYNTGTVRADGGSSTTGDAGTGGYIDLYAYDGTLYSSGTLSVVGGNSTGGFGGDGGYIYFENDGTVSRDIILSGVLQANGGSGDLSGGAGGGIDILPFIDGNILVTSFDGITLNGGAGETGGTGGDIYAYTYSLDGSFPAGPITTDIIISANGGIGTDTGGNGGSFDIATDFDVTLSGATTFITNSGVLSADGGDGITLGGDGGFITLFSTGIEAATIEGTISAAAGDGATPGNDGTIEVDGNTIFP